MTIDGASIRREFRDDLPRTYECHHRYTIVGSGLVNVTGGKKKRPPDMSDLLPFAAFLPQKAAVPFMLHAVPAGLGSERYSPAVFFRGRP